MSTEFRAFSDDYNVEHTTSPSHWPQSNGEAEGAVQTVKQLRRKCKDKYLVLLHYRTTPVVSCGLPPSQLITGLSPRNKLPTSRILLQPNPVNPAEVKCHLTKHRQAHNTTRGKPEETWKHASQVMKWECHHFQWPRNGYQLKVQNNMIPSGHLWLNTTANSRGETDIWGQSLK